MLFVCGVMAAPDAEATDIDTSEDAATTELDSSSSSSEELVLVAVRPAPAAAPSPVDRHRASCADVAQIGWQLQVRDEVDPLGHVVQCVDGFLRRWREFKIGITMNPRRRWELYERSSAT